MKKSLWIVVLALIAIWGISWTSLASQIKDVQPSHWAYKSVKMLVDKGYLALYEDSTFQGERSVTRYQLAEVVAKVLTGMSTGVAAPSETDTQAIRMLAVELRKELVEVIQNQDLFKTDLDQLNKNQIVLKEDLARNQVQVKAEIAKSQQQILEIIDQLISLKNLEEDLRQTNTQQAQLKQQISSLEDRMSMGLMTNLEQINTQFDEVKDLTLTNAEAVANLQMENQDLKEEIDDLVVKNNRMIYYIIAGFLAAILIK